MVREDAGKILIGRFDLCALKPGHVSMVALYSDFYALVGHLVTGEEL